MAAAQWPAVRRLPLRIRVRRGIAHLKYSSWPKLLRLSTWIFGLVVTNQVGFGIALYLANGLQGGPTAYFVAFAFFQLPIGLVAISVVTAVVPSIAGFWVEGRKEAISARLERAIRAISVLLAPATAALVLVSAPAVSLLLERGVMSADSSRLVASTLVAFSIGIVPFSVWVLAVRCFYAMHDSKTPFLLNLVEVGVTVALDFALYPRFHIVGLAAAHSAGYYVGAVLAVAVLFRRLGGGRAAVNLLDPLLRVATAACAAGVGAWALGRLGTAPIVGRLGAGPVSQAVEVAVGGLAVAGAFLGAGLLLRVRDLDMFRRIVTPKELFAEVEEAPVTRRISR